MAEDGLRSKIAPLAQRLVARRERITRATGLAVARSVAERRRPGTLDGSIRLAVGRTMAAPQRVEPAPPEPAEPLGKLPEYISPLAAQIIWGDASRADSEAHERYLARQEAKEQAFATGAALPRGTVLEGPAAPSESTQFRLSRKPAALTGESFGEAVAPQPVSTPAAPASQPEPSGADLPESAAAEPPAPPAGEPEEATEAEPADEASSAPPVLARAPAPIDLKHKQPQERPDRPVVARRTADGEPAAQAEGAASEAPSAPSPPDEAGPEPAATPRPAPVPVEVKDSPPSETRPQPLIARSPAEDTSAADEPPPVPVVPPAPAEESRAAEAPPPQPIVARAPAEELSPAESPSAPASADRGVAEAALADESSPVGPVPEPAGPPPPAEPEPPSAVEPPPARTPGEAPATLARAPETEVPLPAEPAAAAQETRSESRPAPVAIRQVARTESPRRPVLQRRPASPPPIVDAIPDAEPSPKPVEEPAATPPPRGIFRRVLDSVVGTSPDAGPQVAREPTLESADDAPAAAALESTPGGPTPATVSEPEAAEASPVPAAWAPGEAPEEELPTLAEEPAASGPAAAPVDEVRTEPEPAEPPRLLARAARLLRLPKQEAPSEMTPSAGRADGTAAPRGVSAAPSSSGRTAPISRQPAPEQPARAPAPTAAARARGAALSPGQTAPASAPLRAESGSAARREPAPALARAARQEPVIPAISSEAPTIQREASPAGPEHLPAQPFSSPAASPPPLSGAPPAARPPTRALARRADGRPAPVQLENLRIERSSPWVTRTAPGAPSEEPGVDGGAISAATLASATGGTISRTASDLSTVTFPAPPGQASAGEPTIARQPEGNTAAPAPPPATEPGGGSGGGGGGDVQELAEKVIELIKTRALDERERMGDITGELP